MNWIHKRQYLPGTQDIKVLIKLVSFTYTNYELINVKNDPLLNGDYLIKKENGDIETATVCEWASLLD
jgi:hypothetical protein